MYIGSFEVSSGKLIISDPCYERDTPCAGALDKVKNGLWNAYIVKKDFRGWGNRVVELVASIKDYDEHDLDKCSFDVCVDSGQAGIFDDKSFPNEKGEYGDVGGWYNMCCETTDPEIGRGAGVIKGGVVSCSGFGDGRYDAYYHRDSNGEVDFVKIVFITEEEEE